MDRIIEHYHTLCTWICLRFSHLLWPVCPWRGKTRIGSEEKQRGAGHWTKTVGGLPAQGRAWTAHTHTRTPVFLLFDFCYQGGCRLVPGRGLLVGWCDRLSKHCLCFSFWVSDWVQHLMGVFITGILTLFLFYRLSAGRYPKLAKYYSLLKDRPSIKASRPPQWLASPQGHEILKDL